MTRPQSRGFFFAPLVVLFIALTSNAYTLVLVDGRRVEIPAHFQVSKHTLTYQVSSDIQVTLQLKTIDIAATERANNEGPGAFLKHSSGVINQKPPVQRVTVAKRSLTNRELEPYARVRRQSAELYEKRRKELGLPSLEETRRRNLAEAELLRQELEESRLSETEQESYWRSRASELRSEIAATDAEITFVRTRLDEIPVYPTSTFTVVSNAFPIGTGRSFSRGGFRQGSFGRSSRVFTAPRGVTSLTARVGFTGRTLRARTGFNRGFGRTGIFPFGGTLFPPFGNVFDPRFGGRRPFAVAPPFLPFQNATSFSSPFAGYDLGYAREALVVRLDELVGRRAALRARWRDLEEEARRAGAMPGWLRP